MDTIVYHDSTPAHTSAVIADVARRSSFNWCDRCANWYEPAILNSYGELVALHAPVCGRCHQRVALGKLPHTDGAGMNVCSHCTESEVPTKGDSNAA